MHTRKPRAGKECTHQRSRLPELDDCRAVVGPAPPRTPVARASQPTYRVADLSNPILQPWVVEQMNRANDDVIAGKVPFVARERCWPAGVPAFQIFGRVRPVYFMQTPKVVYIIHRGDAQVRRVYMDVPHSANLKPSWYGESIGRYEGDQLVVDTIGLNDKTFVDNYRTPHTDQLHVIERYRLSADGMTMDVTVTIDDPGAFTMPWTARQHYARSEDGPIEEAICAESAGRGTDIFNWGLSHAKDLVPMPQDDTPDF